MAEYNDAANGSPAGERSGSREDKAETAGREEILAKAGELAEWIRASEEVLQFRRAEAQIQHNDKVQKLISAIKKKQKEVVAFESLNNAAMVGRIEGEMAALQEELDSIPIVGEFQQAQYEINDLLQMIVSAVRDTVSETIEVEEGTLPDPESCD